MDERKPRHTTDDVPIIGDYSEAANARLRAESQPAESSQQAPSPPPTRAANRTHAARHTDAEEWRPDPGDVRRHARRMRQRERAGPLAKLSRYGVVALALAAVFAVYWNFETLSQVTVDFSALTSLFAERSDTGSGGTSNLGGESETVAVEAAGVVGAEIATSVGDAPPAEEVSVAEAPAAPPSEGESVGAPIAEPAAAPEPPPGPETFEFALPVMEVSEADASAAVVILRQGDRRRVSSVTWSTRDGTATAGVDYANLGEGVARFAAGEQNRTIHIPIVGDRTVEGPETFSVYLTTSEGEPGPLQQIEVVINDDD